MAEVASRVYDEENVMSVRRRTYRDPETGAVATRWMVDIQQPDGKRVRKVCPLQNKREAERYERELRNELFRSVAVVAPTQAAQPAAPQPVEPEKEVPTFAAFAKIFMATYAKANNKIVRAEPASRASSTTGSLPRFGTRRLDSFTVLDLDTLKAEMLDDEYSRKSVNNTLATGGRSSCTTRTTSRADREGAARSSSSRSRKRSSTSSTSTSLSGWSRRRRTEPEMAGAVLVGGEAGLRMGEMLALSRRTASTSDRGT